MAFAPSLVKLGKKWHIVYTDYAWGQSARDAYVEQIKKNGGMVVGKTGIPLGTADMSLSQIHRKIPSRECLVHRDGGPAAVVGTGNAAAPTIFAHSFGIEFESLDKFTENADARLPTLIAEADLPTCADIMVVGISKHGPAAYLFTTAESLPPGSTPEAFAASPFAPKVGQLVRLPDHVETPQPTDQIVPANWRGFKLDAGPEHLLWSMRKLVTMMRHGKMPGDLGSIGGWCDVVTISANGIEQRVTDEWPEDFQCIGDKIRPAPIDWQAWHRDNPEPVGLVIPEGMSRVRREMMERKARKLKLKVV